MKVAVIQVNYLVRKDAIEVLKWLIAELESSNAAIVEIESNVGSKLKCKVYDIPLEDLRQNG